MKKIILPLLSLMLLGTASNGIAQISYSSLKPFTCDSASRYPVVSFYQFQCRGIPLADSNGNIVGSFYFFSNGNIEGYLPGIPSINPNNSFVTSAPSGNLPPTFTFSWLAQDANGVKHTGTATVTWQDSTICGGRGCIWHAPELTAFTAVVNN
jgi:hypothetical protein